MPETGNAYRGGKKPIRGRGHNQSGKSKGGSSPKSGNGKKADNPNGKKADASKGKKSDGSTKEKEAPADG